MPTNALAFLFRLVLTFLLCMAMVGAGACGIMAGNSTNSADWGWALVALVFCGVLAWTIYALWKQPLRRQAPPSDTSRDR